ncbi:MAG: glycosyltransferase family 39 protein [Campylobacterales bacterium]
MESKISFLRSNYTSMIVVAFLLFLDFLLLLQMSSTLSIGYYEALTLYKESGIVSFIIKTSFELFGQSDFTLRLPFMVLHLLSGTFLYLYSLKVFKRREDALLSFMLFLLLPGVNSSALLVSEASIVIFFLIFYLYLYKTNSTLSFMLLPLMLILDNSFWPLFLSLFFYGVCKKDRALLLGGLIMFGLSTYIHGIDTGGYPRSYFLDSIGGYAAVLSPLLFLYFVYAIYRTLIKEKKNMLWFVVFIPFVIALILSVRQKLDFETFGPYAVIATPMLVGVFMSGYRVRLKEFRGRYRKLFYVVLGFLLLSFIAMPLNRYLYVIYEKPSKHFAYNYQVVKELSDELKNMGINSVLSDDESLLLRLKFYGIDAGGNWWIDRGECKNRGKEVSILYSGITVDTFCVTKVHINR